MAKKLKSRTYRLKVYLDDGVIGQVTGISDDELRDSAFALMRDGFMLGDGKLLIYYPPHRIVKIISFNPDIL